MTEDNKTLSDSELEINLKRKLDEDASQFSEQSLNKKSKQIQCQYNNERLNDDCLAEIFMHVIIYERPKLALVCKRWTTALQSSWYKVKRVKVSDWQRHLATQCIETDESSLRCLESLLVKCCRYLTDLDLTSYTNSNIVPFVNESCPNLVKLQLRFIFIKDKELENAFSRLSQLKILKMIFQGSCGIPESVLYSLTDVADTLSKFTLAHWSGKMNLDYDLPSSFSSIIPQLNALQKFEITGLKIGSSLYESIKNAGLNQLIDNYINYFDNTCTNMSSPFNSLHSLHMVDYEVTDDVLHHLLNNVHLKSIKALSKNITDDGIRAIALMDLYCLTLYGPNDHITGTSIRFLNNLLELCLPYTNRITDDSVTEVLKNSPSMDWLTVVNTRVTPEFPKIASKILSERKQELILCVSFDRNNFSSLGYKLPFLAIHHHDENLIMNKILNGCSSTSVDVVFYN